MPDSLDFLGVMAVTNALLPGMNWCELTAYKSAPIEILSSLGCLKNFLELGLFSWGLNLSYFRIAMILSYLNDILMLELR